MGFLMLGIFFIVILMVIIARNIENDITRIIVKTIYSLLTFCSIIYFLLYTSNFNQEIMIKSLIAGIVFAFPLLYLKLRKLAQIKIISYEQIDQLLKLFFGMPNFVPPIIIIIVLIIGKFRVYYSVGFFMGLLIDYVITLFIVFIRSRIK